MHDINVFTHRNVTEPMNIDANTSILLFFSRNTFLHAIFQGLPPLVDLYLVPDIFPAYFIASIADIFPAYFAGFLALINTVANANTTENTYIPGLKLTADESAASLSTDSMFIARGTTPNDTAVPRSTPIGIPIQARYSACFFTIFCIWDIVAPMVFNIP